MGGLIGTASKNNTGLMSNEWAIRTINKDSSYPAVALDIDLTDVGQMAQLFIGVSNVGGVSCLIALSAVRWNATIVYAKLIVGSIPNNLSLSYILDTKLHIYMAAGGYTLFYVYPILAQYNSVLSSVSSIPSGTTNISYT